MIELTATTTAKPRYSLLPAHALAAVARVMTYGAVKHADEGWRELVRTDAGRRVYLDKAMRHVEEFRLGVARDGESAESPLAHAICDLLILLEAQHG